MSFGLFYQELETKTHPMNSTLGFSERAKSTSDNRAGGQSLPGNNHGSTYLMKADRIAVGRMTNLGSDHKGMKTILFGCSPW